MNKSYLKWGVVALLGFGIGACVQHLPLANNDPAVAETTNIAQLKNLQATYASVAKKVLPAVVNINTTQIIPGRVLRDPFSDFFGSGGGTIREPDRKAQSLGSGVIVNTNGTIITNHHVIANASQITVTLNDERQFSAKIVGSDTDSDVAVLKIQATNLPTLQWDDSNKLQVGDIVLAMGSPFGLSSTVTQGIISAKGRHDLGISPYEEFLQTDAAINPGNSGGALVDLNGNLVGINSAILSESGGNQGIGLAIPSNLVRKISDQLISSGHVTRGWLGIVAQPITPNIAKGMNLPNTNGVLAIGIYDNGPAADLQPGDVLLSVNGIPISSAGQLRNQIADLVPGSTLTLQVWHNGKSVQRSIKVGTRPEKVQGI
jgi:Do/DeqQ family serine protease